MGKFENRRKRGVNFRPNEEKILVSLVKKYQHIVESKKSDTVTNTEKAKAWQKIAQEFSSITGAEKTGVCIRTKFNILKKQVKRTYADEKLNSQATGGGPAVKIQKPWDSEIENDIQSILGNTLTGFTSQYDDAHDTDMGEDKEEIYIEYINDSQTSEDGMRLQDDFVLDVAEDADLKSKENNKCTITSSQPGTSRNSDWSEYTPAKLRQPKTKVLEVKKDSSKNIQNNISNWAQSKVEMVDFQKKAAIEEHSLKLKHMQEKHEHYIKIQTEEWELKKQFLKEEHNLKINLMTRSK